MKHDQTITREFFSQERSKQCISSVTDSPLQKHFHGAAPS